MEKWVKAPVVRDQFGFSKATIGNKFSSDPVPWIKKLSNGRLEVNVEHEGFKQWIPSAVENSERRKNERSDLKDLSNSSCSSNSSSEEHEEMDEDKKLMFAKLAEE